ncbi:peptidoglycan-binding protein, partial [Patescibacteria group bacterium]|nr:peptidoglycan-binding protein [Patescibacteria group bacterium]
NQVSTLQQWLSQDKDIYPDAIVSGYFGPLTEKAVEKFQDKYGIVKSGEEGYGIVGPKTRAKMSEVFNKSNGSSVR